MEPKVTEDPKFNTRQYYIMDRLIVFGYKDGETGEMTYSFSDLDKPSELEYILSASPMDLYVKCDKHQDLPGPGMDIYHCTSNQLLPIKTGKGWYYMLKE